MAVFVGSSSSGGGGGGGGGGGTRGRRAGMVRGDGARFSARCGEGKIKIW